jgi:hypothetical protein
MNKKTLVSLILVLLFVCRLACAGDNIVSVEGDQILLNESPTKIIGLRCSNALISDATTDDLIANLDVYQSYGLNTVSVFFMGSRFGDVKGYRPDASLDPVYAARMGRIIEAADQREMIVLVGCLYWSTSRAKEDLGDWTQEDANRAVANTVQWLSDNDYRNVFVDVDNEGMAHDATDWSIASMIDAAHAIDPSIMIAYNDGGAPPENADLYIHHSPKVEGKPWLDSESTPKNAEGGYWGSFSKQTHQASGDDYCNYSRIGRYTEEMKSNQFGQTMQGIDRYNGIMLASTWLQCSPKESVGGPFATPGGRSEISDVDAQIDELHEDAGILWWLEFVRDRYGDNSSAYPCGYEAKIEIPQGDDTLQATLTLIARSASEYAIVIDSSEISLSIVRSEGMLFLSVPYEDRRVVTLFAHGPLEEAYDPDALGRGGLSGPQAAMTLPTLVTRILGVLPGGDAAVDSLGFESIEPWLLMSRFMITAANAGGEDIAFQYEYDSETETLTSLNATWEGGSIQVDKINDYHGSLPGPTLASSPSQLIEVDRQELERALLLGLTRAAEIFWEKESFRPPVDKDQAGEFGRYLVRDGRRIALLEGSHHEIGLQHGRFLAEDMERTIDSTLYFVGLLYSVEQGCWFVDVLREASARLEPHIPPEYMEELEGMAEGAELDDEEVRLTSYFPELFHCSGFAVSGRATESGALYHGRVLDYMTDLGLQNRSVVFVVAADDRIPFVNVGYAGFHGSVSGMNAERISLGEMGGGGEGDWDGIPMSILMRMALESASTLEEAKAVFRDNPRTCEYFYVFADGKDRSSVGVAAWPDRIEFVEPGEAHPLLQTPQEDCVILSAGDRYDLLCARVKENYGRIDESAALHLMDDPVAMGDDNLHNVLFVPETLRFYVADASHDEPACDQPYRKYELSELLELLKNKDMD